MSDDTFNSLKSIETETSKCVKCGLCLSVCPTYVNSQIECQSPRGRISLIKAEVENKIPYTRQLEHYLDDCLLCKACEVVCPAEVNYSDLLISYRHRQNIRLKGRKVPWYLQVFLLKQSGQYFSHFLFKLIGVLKRSMGVFRFQHLFKSKWKKLLQLVPIHSNQFSYKHDYSSRIEHKETIILLNGCLNSLVDQDTLIAAVYLLNCIGYSVEVPQEQPCCGALHFHNGQLFEALNLFKQHQLILEKFKSSKLVSIVTGCSAVLKQYPKRFELPSTFQTLDILEFVPALQHLQLKLSPLPKKIYLHHPCSKLNDLKLREAEFNLLNTIPEIKLISSPISLCCGASGSYMIEHAERSEHLAASLIDDIIEKQPDIIVTSNIGCKLHLQACLENRSIFITFLHPITLFYQQTLKK